jgi:hypothetical protein
MLEQLIRAHIEDINRWKDSILFQGPDSKKEETKKDVIMDTITFFREKVNDFNRFNNDDSKLPDQIVVGSRLSSDNFLMATDSESESESESSDDESQKYQETESEYSFDEIDNMHKILLNETMNKALINRLETRFNTFKDMLHVQKKIVTSSQLRVRPRSPSAIVEGKSNGNDNSMTWLSTLTGSQ